MLKHLRQLLAAAILAAFVVAPTAFAGSGKNPKPKKYPSSCVSAVCVYHEPGVTGVGGPSNGSNTGGSSTSSATEKPVPIPASVTKKLRKYGGKDSSVIESIASTPGFGNRSLETSAATVAEPSALGATFDAGSGMTILISLLLATTVFLAVFEGVRRVRRR